MYEVELLAVVVCGIALLLVTRVNSTVYEVESSVNIFGCYRTQGKNLFMARGSSCSTFKRRNSKTILITVDITGDSSSQDLFKLSSGLQTIAPPLLIGRP